MCKLILVGLLLAGLLDPPGIGGIELVERFTPAHGPLSLDEACGLVAAFAGCGAPVGALAGARLSSLLMMASQSSLTTASPGEWPRALVTLRRYQQPGSGHQDRTRPPAHPRATMPSRACHTSFMQTSETYMITWHARIYQPRQFTPYCAYGLNQAKRGTRRSPAQCVAVGTYQNSASS